MSIFVGTNKPHLFVCSLCTKRRGEGTGREMGCYTEEVVYPRQLRKQGPSARTVLYGLIPVILSYKFVGQNWNLGFPYIPKKHYKVHYNVFDY